MDIHYTFVIILMLLSVVYCRGPHHPRGDSVVKHHVHYRPTKSIQSDKLTQDDQLLHDREHIREELGEWVPQKDLDTMTEEELEFHYFDIHDSDRNEKLDGLELLQAMTHTVYHHDDDEDDEDEENFGLNSEDFMYFIELIDEVLKEDDLNDDGFLSYPEYVTAKRKEDKMNKAINELQIEPKYEN